MSDKISRRELGKTVGRLACGGALAGLTAYLGLRSTPEDGNDRTVRIHNVCRQCGVLRSCTYPEAKQTRLALARRSDVRVAQQKESRDKDKKECPFTRT